MTAPQNRLGHVAIIVTAREYQALAAAKALVEVEQEGREVEPDERADLRALHTLLVKCRDAGIRTSPPPPKDQEPV